VPLSGQERLLAVDVSAVVLVEQPVNALFNARNEHLHVAVLGRVEPLRRQLAGVGNVQHPIARVRAGNTAKVHKNCYQLCRAPVVHGGVVYEPEVALAANRHLAHGSLRSTEPLGF
jgi:hypothetical protein